MVRNQVFALRLSPIEREGLDRLAKLLDQSRSATIRRLVVEADAHGLAPASVDTSMIGALKENRR